MATLDLSALEAIVTASTGKLKNVTSKKMFGCPAYWVNGNVFALVWKKGRIGVRLPDSAQYAKLMAVDGAAPWKAGPMTMSHWVLVPEQYHSSKSLQKWIDAAYELNASAKPAAKSKPKASAKKPSAKKARA